MALSRLRWACGGVIAALSLIVALRALGAYLDHRLWLGSASVVLLAAIAVAGLVSLGKARLRIERELAGLDAVPPTGDWIARRRARLERVRASGATLDLDAIATATAAEQRGRAYLGRYLVAVTVLVGLVGTFAGLMDTLRGVALLLRDEHLSTAQALALPLAGLDVTFGASVVGILVTLALALVQGDLVLAEEQALAQLEDLTAHSLVPAIWPAATRSDERVAAEVAALRSDVRGALAAVGQATADRVAALARVEVDRLVATTRETLERVGAASVEAVRAMQQSAAQTAGSLQEAAASARTAAHDAAQQVNAAVAASADAAAQSIAAGARDAQTAVAAATADVQRTLGEVVERSLTANDALAARATALVADAHAQGERTTAEATAAAEVQLRAAGSALAEAAGELRGSSANLAASLGTLAPELSALAREVALLAARDDGGGADAAIGEELVRLGDGLERLEQLLASERGRRERA
ncbi:MAG: hypothetical protein ACXVAN_07720 [Polyangia bacterium]